MTDEANGTGGDSQESSGGETLTEEQDKQQQSDQATVESVTAELASARAALKKANAEAAQRRKALAAFEKAEEERKAADLSEVETAQKAAQGWEEKHTALLAELDTSKMRSAFYDEIDTQELTFPNPQAKKDAFALSDLSSVTKGDDGNLDGITEVVKALIKSHPHLFAAPQTKTNINADNGGGGQKEATEEQLIEYAARMGLKVKHLDPALVAQAIQ